MLNGLGTTGIRGSPSLRKSARAKARGEDALSRMAVLAWRLARGKTVTSSFICNRFRVSAATAKRDLARLEAALPLLRHAAPLGEPHILEADPRAQW